MNNLITFVITIVSMLMLMTAVELIAPENGMKKYLKYVLGLILISVMLTPILSILSKGEYEILSYISKYEKGYKSSGEKSSREKIKDEKQRVFKENLQENCVRMLKNEFSDKAFKVDIDCSINTESMTYSINEVKVGVKDKSVKSVKRIVIDTRDESKEVVSSDIESEEQRKVSTFIRENLDIPDEKIEVYILD